MKENDINIACMPRQKRPTTAKSLRLLEDIAEALDRYADEQLISTNAAINKLLRDKLSELGYYKPDDGSVKE